MSKQIDITDYIESMIDVPISIDEAIAALKQNFKENIEAGAPRELINNMYNAIQLSCRVIRTEYMKYLRSIKKEDSK